MHHKDQDAYSTRLEKYCIVPDYPDSYVFSANYCKEISHIQEEMAFKF